MTPASDGPWRPTPPVGMNSGASSVAPKRAAASTRRRSAPLGRPSGRTAAPKITMAARPLTPSLTFSLTGAAPAAPGSPR